MPYKTLRALSGCQCLVNAALKMTFADKEKGLFALEHHKKSVTFWNNLIFADEIRTGSVKCEIRTRSFMEPFLVFIHTFTFTNFNRCLMG